MKSDLNEYEIRVTFKIATYVNYETSELFNVFRNEIDKAVRDAGNYNNIITSNMRFETFGEK